MAFLDDEKWLLSFIRNLFIVSDDTGICENVLSSAFEPEDTANSFGTSSTCSPLSIHEDDGITIAKPCRSYSPDITIDLDSRSIRRRSNTAVRLEKVRKEREERGRVQITHWTNDKLLSKPSDVAIYNEAFSPIQPPRKNGALKHEKKSALSFDLKTSERMNSQMSQQMIFKQYMKFDGKGLPKTHASRFKIFMHLPELENEAQKPSIIVTITADARFADLVGLTCMQWTESRPDIVLRHSPNKYFLRMVEENGELDQDFPDMQVEMTELVHKFSNSSWALMEAVGSDATDALDVIKVNFVEGSFSKFTVEPGETFQIVLDKVLKKRKLKPSTRGIEYMLEKVSEPGVPVDLSHNVGSARCREFFLIRSNSKNPALSARELDLVTT